VGWQSFYTVICTIRGAVGIGKGSGGFPFGGTVDDVIARRQVTAWNFL
jgi:hypothetical protein